MDFGSARRGHIPAVCRQEKKKAEEFNPPPDQDTSDPGIKISNDLGLRRCDRHHRSRRDRRDRHHHHHRPDVPRAVLRH